MDVLEERKARLATADNKRASIAMRLVTKGGEFLKAGEPQRALTAYLHARDILDGLSANEKDNTDLGLTLSLVYRKIGDAMRAQGDPAGAKEAYRSSLAILEGLANFHPDNAELQRHRTELLETLSMVNDAMESSPALTPGAAWGRAKPNVGRNRFTPGQLARTDYGPATGSDATAAISRCAQLTSTARLRASVEVPVMTTQREGAPSVYNRAEVFWMVADNIPSRPVLGPSTPAYRSICCERDRLHLRRRCWRVERLGHGWECNATDHENKAERQKRAHR